MLNNYSPNMLKTFDECQRKFYFKYIEKKALPQRATIFEKGKKIHALASYFLNGKNIEKLEKVLNADEKLTWESLKSNKYFLLTPVETEYSLTCKIDKYWVGGRLDALMQDCPPPQPSPSRGAGDSTHLSPLTTHYVILDYKTGQIPKNAEFDFQTMVYLLATDKLLNKKGGYESLKFVYLGLKNNTEKVIIFTSELKNQYEDKIIKTCKDIDFALSSNLFRKSEKCQHCEFQKLCERD